MAHLNTTHFNEFDTMQSNYTSLTQPNEGDVSYSKIPYDRNTEMIKLSSANLSPTRPIQRPNTNIHTCVTEHGGIEKKTDRQLVKFTCQKSKLKVFMIIIGMVAISAASSTITALIQKQSFDNLLTDIREEMDLIKQDIRQELTWSEWSPWGDCTATCNGGIQSRERTCNGSDNGKHVCEGNDVDIAACNNNTCMVPMVYFAMTKVNKQLVNGKVTFSHTIAGSGFNNQTGEFVCPVAGLYHFSFSFVQRHEDRIYCMLEHNGSWLTQIISWAHSPRYTAATTSVYIQLAVGDVVYIGDCSLWEYALHDGLHTVFTGSLIHL